MKFENINKLINDLYTDVSKMQQVTDKPIYVYQGY